MVSPKEALERLQEGNRRFRSNARKQPASLNDSRRAELAKNQRPFAVVLACSDSRVPPEAVFDQDLGALFVVRVAGNIAEPTQVGSVEFAAHSLDARLVVVLGHTGCGAVMATVDQLEKPESEASGNLQAILDSIRPSVAPWVDRDPKRDREWVVRQAVRSNALASARQLRRSELLRPLIETGGLQIVGAEYSLETGIVEFLDDPECAS